MSEQSSLCEAEAPVQVLISFLHPTPISPIDEPQLSVSGVCCLSILYPLAVLPPSKPEIPGLSGLGWIGWGGEEGSHSAGLHQPWEDHPFGHSLAWTQKGSRIIHETIICWVLGIQCLSSWSLCLVETDMDEITFINM